MALQIYLAAPLFSAAEQNFNARLAKAIEAKGNPVFLPQAECAQLQEIGEIYRTCREGIERSHVVVAILDGADADSGTCWECGYATGMGIPVIALRTDFRQSGDVKGFNAMLYASANTVILAEAQDDIDRQMDDLAAKIVNSLETAIEKA